ncbi:CD63 antigen-like [Achroia grisella]|uniref:CD63 antigen-like n=1 Tax=Achroia grisella TaxID=688607 RepID=UPI0027D2FBCC|nr:CD63 antigen-like [Achroia grisella]
MASPATMKFTKTEAEYNMKSIRFLLLTITTMFIIIGILMIVLGISVYTHYHSFSYFYESAMRGSITTPSVLSVFLGLVLLLVTFFGFWGSIKRSTCMINFYAVLLGFILLIKLVIVILAFTMDTATLMNYIYLPMTYYETDPEVRAEINCLQSSLNCCGSSSYFDYAGMQLSPNETVTVKSNHEQGIIFIEVPKSCCAIADGDECLRVRSAGCSEVLVGVLVQNASVLGVLGVSVMFIILLGIVFALLLARSIRKYKSERAMLQWKIREQIIMARENEKEIENNPVVYITVPESSSA